MASKLFEQAKAGDEVALLQITWQIENKQLGGEDIRAIFDIAKIYDSSNKLSSNEKYILGLAYYFGVGFFGENKEKSKEIFSDLSEKDNFVLAKTMLASLDNNLAQFKKIMNIYHEPLATLHLAEYSMRHFGYRLGHEDSIRQGLTTEGDTVKVVTPNIYIGFGFGSPTPYKEKEDNWGFEKQSFFARDEVFSHRTVLQIISPLLPMLADAYQTKLKNTSYKRHADLIIAGFHEDVMKLKEALLSDKEIGGTSEVRVNKSIKELMGDRFSILLKELSDILLELAKYYKETYQSYLMYEVLHYAVEINRELDSKLYEELIGDKPHYSWVKASLYNYLSSAENYAMQVQDITMNEDVINTNFHRLSIDLKNCTYLVYKLDNTNCLEKELGEIQKLLNDCSTKHDKLQKKVEARAGLKEIKLQLSM